MEARLAFVIIPKMRETVNPIKNAPNQALEPTIMLVTIRASPHFVRARIAPSMIAAQLERSAEKYDYSRI
jgi:hypothetical protein